LVGESITIEGISTLNGTYVITSLPSTTTFTFTKTGLTPISATSVTGATVRARSLQIKSRQLIGNIVTITTTNAHGAIVGEQVIISGIDATFNGTYTIASIPTPNSFTYAKTADNVVSANVTGALAELPGTITSQDVIPSGQATVSGSISFQGSAGTATVSDTIPRTLASGKAIKKNDVPFTPGISGALAKGDTYKPTKDGVIIYFHSKNIDETLEKVIQQNGSVFYPKTSVGSMGFVAEFIDTEGNRIAIHQDI
jgi:predicted enzyme related to lactoylglutathione lyase